ncbi:hypothetical protein HIM_03788 [Hirsutella minnesotensis 3608]|uniref:glutamate--tRNA ligase n=1 Tax=Hirsutella minnesotensis 3608 TaxID=1043627 RepID=A0A0F7ZM23_9HYPO|nr:hypothetical protein HIM_03788 [Hirsutella minnesotensis 3608]
MSALQQSTIQLPSADENTQPMAAMEVVVGSDPAIALPAIVLADFAAKSQRLPSLQKTIHNSPALLGGASVRLTSDEDESFVDDAAIDYLTFITRDTDSDGPENASSTKWITKRSTFGAKSYHVLNKALAELDLHLTLRTYIAGFRIAAADLAVWATLRANHRALSLVKKFHRNVLRWYEHVEYSAPWVSEALAFMTNSANDRTKEKADASARGAGYEIDLPQIKGPMVTRFPPEPSGYLHVGHAKAALLNDFFAHQKPGGTLICRFDDTNPSNESMEFQNAIIDDLRLMGVIPDKTSFSSDYFQVMYDYAIQLINDGKAFADDSELGKGDEDRKNRLPSKRRGLSVQQTLAKFAEMKAGSEQGQRWCLRAKIVYDSPNGTLRDPVIYRCNLTPHHRTGTAWKIYPTYDFCAPILDSLEGVTLALRTNEFRDRNAQYEWFQDALGLRKVDIWDFSRINFIRTVLSKRKLTKIVNGGTVGGWDDPRMPTIRGIVRRGMTVQALRKFILQQGPSRNVLNLEWGALWALNKKYVDPICSRHTAVVAKDTVTCTLLGIDEPSMVTKPKYHKNLDLGTKKIVLDRTILIEQVDALDLAIGEEITLMNWGNAFVRGITRIDDSSPIKAMTLELNLGGDVKKTKKITWLAAAADNLVPVDLVSFDYLITKNKLEKTDKIEDFLAPKTEFREQAFADCNVSDLKPGAMVQFERKGYFVLDGRHPQDSSRLVFFDIPSGKS